MVSSSWGRQTPTVMESRPTSFDSSSKTRPEVMKPTQRPRKWHRRPRLARNSSCNSRVRGPYLPAAAPSGHPRFRTLDLLLQLGRKLLWRTSPGQRLAGPVVEENEGRSASDTDRLRVVHVTQHSLQGVAARQAGREPGPIQLQVSSEADQ